MICRRALTSNPLKLITKEELLVMSKKLNTVFFGLCLLTAFILEVYCIYILDGDLFTVIGIGVVVIIIGYLFFDSLRIRWNESFHNMKNDVEKMHQEELEAIKKDLSLLCDLQKATYSATKKNEKFLQEEIKGILDHLSALQKEHGKTIEEIVKLQRKSMEGQKNALNLNLNYSKENTQQLMDVFQEESTKLEQEQERLCKFLSEINNRNASDRGSFSENKLPKTEAEDPNWIEEEAEIQPIYDDPNKNLTTEEISSLFDTYGK
jgi:hypothetical protein